MRLGANLIRLGAAIADDRTSRAVRQLEDVVSQLLGHVHAVASKLRPGFAPALSGVATQYLDGTGAWSTPAGGGGGGGVPTSRTISTTAPLTGGGDLTANRTLAVSTFGAGSSGVVPASGGGTSNFLRADGTWAAPGGGGGGIAGELVAVIPYAGSNTGTFTITDAGIDPTSKILVGWGSVVDTDDNTPESDLVNFSLVSASSGSAVARVSASGPVGGGYRVSYMVVA